MRVIDVREVLKAFSKACKEGMYNKMPYDTWRSIKSCETAELHVPPNQNTSYMIVEWYGERYSTYFKNNDESFGEFLFNEVILLDFWDKYELTGSNTAYSSTFLNYDTSELTNALQKASVSLHTLSDNMRIATAEAVGGLRKENNDMNLFKGFEFGSCENDNVKVSMYGVAVKNATGAWVSYDAKSGNIIDVDILNFDAKYLYKMPVAIKDVRPGDVVIHNRKPVFVIKVEGGKLDVIDPAAGEEKLVLLTKSMFGFDFVTKVINLFGDVSVTATADQPFGNILPLMMLSDGKSSDMLPLLMMNGGFDMSNPMMLYFLVKDNKNNDILPFLLMSGNLGKTGCCGCGCKDTSTPTTEA